MEINFNWIKYLGLDSAALLGYLLNNAGNRNLTCVEKAVIMKDLNLTLCQYRSAREKLVDMGIVEIVPNYVTRVNVYKLIHEEIDLLTIGIH